MGWFRILSATALGAAIAWGPFLPVAGAQPSAEPTERPTYGPSPNPEVDSWEVSSAEPARARHYYAGLGLLFHGLGEYATEDTGESSFLTAPYLQLVAMARFPLSEKWGFSPAITLTPFGHESADGGSRALILTLAGRAYRKVTGQFDLIGGLGLLGTIVRGSGGTTELRNGDGTTVFAFPSGTSVSRVLYLEGGAGFRVFESLRLESALLLASPLSGRRSLSWVAQLSYGVF